MVSVGCVRVSLFQASSPPSSGRAKAQARRAPLRSRAEDYRGDLLIPLESLTSAFLQGAAREAAAATVEDLRNGLEARLSAHCVLHVPAEQSKRFVEEHQLTASSVTLSPTPAAAGRVSASPCSSLPPTQPPFRCCASCSSSVATEAAAAEAATCSADPNTSLSKRRSAVCVPQAPWISICQLQRMPQRHGGVAAPSSPLSGAAPTHQGPLTYTAEEWMLRQHGSQDVYLSAAEARAVGAVDAEAEAFSTDKVEGGACYAAFFCLTTIAASEQAVRVASLRTAAPQPAQRNTPASSAASLAPTAFTVYALQRTLRVGVPRGTAAPPEDMDTHVPRLHSLQDIVVDRLATQRGVRVTRLLDAQTGAAVLPGEDALALLAAEVTALEAECAAPSSQPHRRAEYEALTQLLERAPETPPLSPARAAAKGGVADVASELLDRLVGSRAHAHAAEQFYYDGADAYGWAEQRTLISLSEVPSDPELQLSSHDTHVSLTPRRGGVSSQQSAEASPMALLSSDNSHSRPVPCVPRDASDPAVETHAKHADVIDDEADAEGVEPSHATGAHGTAASRLEHRFISPVNADSSRAHADAEAGEEETVRLSPVQQRRQLQATLPGAAPVPLRDSLWDMNEVFVYEDDASDAEGGIGATETEVIVEGGSSGSQRREQRRGSLVWSTPLARGSAGTMTHGDTGVSTTPLLYRTSSRISLSPPVQRGTAHSTPTTAPAERPTQRMLLAGTDSFEDDGGHDASEDAGAREEEASRDAGGEAAIRSAGCSGDAEETEDEEASRADASAVASSLSSAASHRTASSSPNNPAAEATPPRPAVLAASQIGGLLLAAMPSPAAAVSLPSPDPHQPAPPRRPAALFGAPVAFSAMELDERTTSMAPPPCSTPPLPLSPSRASAQELRSRLQSINPVPTQSSSSTPPQAEPQDNLVLSAEGAKAHPRVRVREAIALDVPDLPPTGDAVSPRGENSACAPSAAVASRAQRTRSPIFFSAEELHSMAVDGAATTATTASDDNRLHTRSPSSRRGPLSSALVRTSPSPSHSHRHHHYGYGHYIASYPLRHGSGGTSTSGPGADQESGGAIVDGGGEWTCGGSARSAALLRSSRYGAADGEERFVPSSSLSPSSTSQRVPGRGTAVEERVRSAAASSAAIALTSGATTSPNRPVQRGKRRRSPSASASGLETWIRFSDADKSSSDGGDASDDAGLHMLVTQQELPMYTGQSDASSTETDVGGDGDSDGSGSEST